jgi:hypothetical protein
LANATIATVGMTACGVGGTWATIPRDNSRPQDVSATVPRNNTPEKTYRPGTVASRCFAAKGRVPCCRVNEYGPR